PRLSPNGQSVAVEIGSVFQGKVEIHDVVRGTTTKLTQDGVEAWPAWRNNREIAVFSRRPTATGMYLKDLAGSERLLFPSPADSMFRPGSWSPDGKLLAYTVQKGSQHDIWILSMDNDKPAAKPLLNTAAAEHSPTFSPDGHWLAYVSDESG